MSLFQHAAARRRLGRVQTGSRVRTGFNTQPPEGGWDLSNDRILQMFLVSTRSRPKAAGSTCQR